MTLCNRILPGFLPSIRKRYIAFVLVCFILLLIPNRKVRTLWDYKAGTRLQSHYSSGLSLSLSSSEWGLMGKQFKQLGQWATDLNDHPSVGGGDELMDTLTARFKWLHGANDSMHKPWGSGESEKLQPSRQAGMVVCSGSSNYHLAAHLIVTLRQVHKSTIPIQVAYAGDEDLKPEHREYLQHLASGVTFIDLLAFFPGAHDDLVGGGWAMKPFALLASSYPRTMLVDADALFLLPPDDLFETHPDLARTGTLFYHDRAASGGGDDGLNFLKDQIKAAEIEPSNFLRNESLFYSGDSWYEAESGFLCLDKSKPQVWMGLIFTIWMNTKEVREEISYKLFYGDKETYWIAMELSSAEYYFQPLYAGSIGTISDDGATELCTTHPLHMDRNGKSPFWLNGGVYQQKSAPSDGYARLTHYWAGNLNATTKAHWNWMDGNVACIKEKGVNMIDDEMLKTIESIIREATNIDHGLHSA